MSPNKLITGAELATVQRWEAPSVESPTLDTLPTAEQLARLQEQAYREGFALGRQEGLAAGDEEVRHRVERLEAILQLLSTPLTQLDEEVERELAGLAMDMTRQLVRREIKADPGQIIAVVHEALAALPIGQRSMRLFLHPDDAAVVREALTTAEGPKQWTIIEDPVLARGGCRVLTESSSVDATVQARLAAIFARVVGGEREGDRNAT